MTMAPPKHAMLRDGTRWEGIRMHGLEANAQGSIGLVKLPGAPPDRPVVHPGPWEAPPSGLAAGPEKSVCIADTDHDRVLCSDTLCNRRISIRGAGFASPRGLALADGRLYAADSGNARIQVFRSPDWGLETVWQGPLVEPLGVAVDSTRRVYVLDGGRRSILRFSASGRFDRAYSEAMTANGELVEPAFLAMGPDDCLYVSDRARNQVLRFDAGATALDPLTALDAKRPRALAAGKDRLFVADAADGKIRAFDLQAVVDLGSLPDFCAPVTAMLLEEGGALWVKTDPALGLERLPAAQGCVSQGVLIAGPLDAGVAQVWERLRIQVEDKAPANVAAEVFLAPTDTPAPQNGQWVPSAALDTLLPPPRTDASSPAPSARYLWLRVRLFSPDRRSSPLLVQVHATTTAPSYIDDLPAVYARRDAGSGFLRRWLALFRAEVGDTETLLDDMARRFDPLTTPDNHLEWLAQWLGLDLPDRQAPAWSIPWLRQLIRNAHMIHTRRGTRQGLREAVARHTGIRVEIIEAYRHRRIWQLGTTSHLGFETGLATARPDGAIVPDPNASPVVGEFTVDQSGPQREQDFGGPLFEPTAHLFSVVIPAGRCLDEKARARLRAVIDAEKPANTDYHLCVPEPRMRVGFQARIGIDTLVAGPQKALALDVARLGQDAFVADTPGPDGASVGRRMHIGQTTRVG